MYVNGEISLNNNYRPRRPYQPTHNFVLNYNIKAHQITCIDDTDQNLGLISLDEAVKLATAKGLDVIMVSGGTRDRAPICRILDFGKYRYEQEKKDKALKKKQRENAIKIKEVKLHPSTSDNDIQTKARQMSEFIEDGNRIRLVVVFRGREMAHKELGFETLKKFTQLVGGQFDGEPAMTGKILSVMLVKAPQEKKQVSKPISDNNTSPT